MLKKKTFEFSQRFRGFQETSHLVRGVFFIIAKMKQSEEKQ